MKMQNVNWIYNCNDSWKEQPLVFLPETHIPVKLVRGLQFQENVFPSQENLL